MSDDFGAFPKVLTSLLSTVAIAVAFEDVTAALLAGILVALMWVVESLHHVAKSAADTGPVSPKHARIIQLVARAVREISG